MNVLSLFDGISIAQQSITNCGIDMEKSNKNWKVYKQNEKCECGKCDYIPDILLDKN